MQFGVGILGSGWDEEAVRERVRTDTRPAHARFAERASSYAAKVAAETFFAEPPTRPDLSDEALLDRLALCGRPVRPSEVAMVREAFLAEYGERA